MPQLERNLISNDKLTAWAKHPPQALGNTNRGIGLL